MSQKSVRDGEDHWVHPITGQNKKAYSCSQCGGEMGHIGELRIPKRSTPGSGSRVADLECKECGHRLRNATLRGF